MRDNVTQPARLRLRVAACGLVLAVLAIPILATASDEQAAAETKAPQEFDFDGLNSKIQAAIARAKPACVAVSERRGRGGGGSFSGVLVSSDGHVLTAAHCVEPKADYLVTLIDGRRLSATGMGASSILDCGIIKIDRPEDVPFVEMGSSSDLQPDQPCLSISHPSGLDRDRGLVIRFGRVVGRNRRGHIHNTCLMEPGDSGGGLFDLQGRVIGIHSYIARDLDDNFDIPIDWFRTHWEKLCEPQEFNPPFGLARWGVLLNFEQATDDGVQVSEVPAGSPAEEAGLKAGDLITAVNGSRLHSGFDIRRSWRRIMPRGDAELQLTYLRGEETGSLTIPRPESPSPSPAVSGASSRELEVFRDLAERLAEVEDRLDDCCVQIRSTKGRRPVVLLGTVIRHDGLIVSKNSEVGQSPQVVDGQGKSLPAKVVARDEANDLVILQVDAVFDQAVDLTRAGERAEGEILLSPRPGPKTGLLSVVGSRAFRSPRQREIGFLGVTLELQGGKVALKEINGKPAERAGLKSGDIVVRLDDLQIQEIQQLVSTVRAHAPGDDVRVTIQRDDAEQIIEVTLGIRPPSSGMHVADQFAGGSSLRKSGFSAVFCHDAHVEPEECGGPLFDTGGDFIGINVARYSRTHCYAMPADTVREIVERMKP